MCQSGSRERPRCAVPTANKDRSRSRRLSEPQLSPTTPKGVLLRNSSKIGRRRGLPTRSSAQRVRVGEEERCSERALPARAKRGIRNPRRRSGSERRGTANQLSCPRLCDDELAYLIGGPRKRGPGKVQVPIPKGAKQSFAQSSFAYFSFKKSRAPQQRRNSALPPLDILSSILYYIVRQCKRNQTTDLKS